MYCTKFLYRFFRCLSSLAFELEGIHCQVIGETELSIRGTLFQGLLTLLLVPFLTAQTTWAVGAYLVRSAFLFLIHTVCPRAPEIWRD
jgi:hypothetical protein